MKNSRIAVWLKSPKILSVLSVLILTPLTALGQGGATPKTMPTADQFAGSYKGTAKFPTGEKGLTLEIKAENGKLAGRLVADKAEYLLSSSELVDGKLTIKFVSSGAPSVLVLQRKDEKLVGEWKTGAETRAVELSKVIPAVETAAKPATEAAAADPLSGEWEAAADVQGQAFPFELSLKVEGDKVTGTSSSQLGNSNVSSGSWKDGKLALVLESANGQIALLATMIDGKLVGDFDYSGQLSGKWIAAKKKP
jgi:hypothetical protein